MLIDGGTFSPVLNRVTVRYLIVYLISVVADKIVRWRKAPDDPDAPTVRYPHLYLAMLYL